MMSMNERKIVDVMWFSPGRCEGCLGIVLVQEIDDGMRAYIGTGAGFSEDTDMNNIADWGASFPIEAAKALFPRRFAAEQNG